MDSIRVIGNSTHFIRVTDIYYDNYGRKIKNSKKNGEMKEQLREY